MLDFDIYAINTEDDEYKSSDKEFYLSFDEAMKNRFKYSNWYRKNGNVWIKRYQAGIPHAVELWKVNEDGTFDAYYDRRKKS